MPDNSGSAFSTGTLDRSPFYAEWLAQSVGVNMKRSLASSHGVGLTSSADFRNTLTKLLQGGENGPFTLELWIRQTDAVRTLATREVIVGRVSITRTQPIAAPYCDDHVQVLGTGRRLPLESVPVSQAPASA